jgi:iron complex transport system ATP-binding protein
MSIITVDAVSFSYPGARKKALDSVSFSVEAGEHIALVGPNGSGKSTLFTLLAGFFAPERGAVLLDGKGIRTYPARIRARRLALVPQGKRFGFPYTCLETVLMGLHPHQDFFAWPGDAALSRAEDLMRETGIWDMASRPVTGLSGGELQRVILTRALLQILPEGRTDHYQYNDDDGDDGNSGATKLLLLDEALSELDVSARIAAMKLLNRLTAEYRITVIGIHHDLHLAGRFVDRIIALRAGRIAGDGTPDSVFTEAFFERVFQVEAEIVPGRGFFFKDEIAPDREPAAAGVAGDQSISRRGAP